MITNISVPTTSENFFRQYLELLSKFPPLNILRNKELDLLALLMYNWHKYDYLDRNDRGNYIFSTAKRKEYCTILDIKIEGLTTLIYELRKKKMIVNNQILPELEIELSNDITLSFNFKIGDYGRKQP